MSFGKEMLGFVVGNLNSFTITVYDALVASWPAMTITTLYIVICGYMIITGNAGKHAKELGVSMVLLVILQSVVQSGYTEWVSVPVLSMADGLGQLAVDATGVRGGDIFQALDDGLGQIITTVSRIEPTGNIFTSAWLYIKVGVASLLLTIGYGLMYVVFLALILMAYFSTYMMLMVGGIFLWLASFNATRQYTYAWLKAIANYVVWIFYLSAVMGFFMNVTTDYITLMSQWDLAVDGAFPPTLGKIFFLGVLVYYLLMKTADWSATLTGGTAMSPGIVTSGVGAVGGAVKGLAGSEAVQKAGGWAAGKAGGMALAGGARAYSALRGVFKK
ncbi:MAG: type IV secretion system protein [Gallionella sp.]|nr:type IV secretion system protein [Gallionella sp.]